jgi:hypothetical protein
MTGPQAPRQTLDKWIMLNKGASAAIVLAVVGVLAVVLSIAVSGGSKGTAYSPSPGGGGTTQVQQAAPTLSHIQQTNLGSDETIYRNYWSDGSSTVCMVHLFEDTDTQSASGNCAPDGIANGMTSG